jgi:molybdenum cofactor cytidylyltransferase
VIAHETLKIDRTVLVLLAAGRGSRFGDIESKLDQEFLGKPLGLHVAVALEDLPFLARIVVVGGSALDYGRFGFDVLCNDDPGLGMARSVRIGIEAAEKTDADAVLIALADMPRVTAAHIHRLFDASVGADTVVASSDGCDPKPPALFGRGRFAFLKTLQGDAGARDLVRAGRHVVTAPAELIDVDTPEELEALRQLVHSPEAITRRPRRHDP